MVPLDLRWSRRRVVLLNVASLTAFEASLKGLSAKAIEEVTKTVSAAAPLAGEEGARLLLFLYVVLLVRSKGPWLALRTRSRHIAAVAGTRVPRARRDIERYAADDVGDYHVALRLMRAALKRVRPGNYPLGLWILNYYEQTEASDRWETLERSLSHWVDRGARNHTEALALWIAARELLIDAIESGWQERFRRTPGRGPRDKVARVFVRRPAIYNRERGERVGRALRHYKAFMSGSYAEEVTKGRTRRLIERDALQLASDFPAFLQVERSERVYFENWFLARFALFLPLRFALPRWWSSVVLAAATLAVLTAAILAARFNGGGPGEWWELQRAWGLPMEVTLVATPFAAFIFSPRVFRVLYPRLFAGAILGWSSVVGTIGTEAMWGGEGKAHFFVEGLKKGEMSWTSMWMFGALLVILWFFLYHEVYGTLGRKLRSAVRAACLLAWAFFLVALIGLVGSMGLENLLSETALLGPGRFAVFSVGSIVSLYVAVITQLLWADRGVSATLSTASEPDRR